MDAFEVIPPADRHKRRKPGVMKSLRDVDDVIGNTHDSGAVLIQESRGGEQDANPSLCN